MNKIIFMVIFSFFATGLSAKCFSFSKNKEYQVCIDGNDNSVRKQASKVCKSKSGKDCGNITGYKGNCNSNGRIQCLDGNGAEKKSLKVK